MAQLRKNVGRGLGLMFVGYAAGLLTAPRSGKQTRRRIKKEAKSSVNDMEKQLKVVYKDTKQYLDKLAEDSPKVTTKLKEAKSTAQKSQTKVKQLLSAIHGEDNFDDDLESALKSAKTSLDNLKHYISK